MGAITINIFYSDIVYKSTQYDAKKTSHLPRELDDIV